ncbi:hypothetical protein HLASF_0444 [Halanaeroarchaeum sulfurireducens]|uniref:Uncharacterized protein n=1 Tax=Halanaeroarchaeum sulfurireducens TaxID=1604004 RepID=A0A0F7P9T4_9EURY|nr:hypothetical protein HLASF_0444 [Halanaeroarchaeum sulfurireducens]ALG81351.1 hypothetical protein HLASA_0442 [Halanaeroarchaeum sulfurireducens]
MARGFAVVSGTRPAERPVANLIPPALVPGRDSRGTSNTRTHRECHRNRGRLLLPWRVCPWASAPSRGRDTGPAHRVLPRSGCAGFARPITWVPIRCTASRYLKTGRGRAHALHPRPRWGGELALSLL